MYSKITSDQMELVSGGGIKDQYILYPLATATYSEEKAFLNSLALSKETDCEWG